MDRKPREHLSKAEAIHNIAVMITSPLAMASRPEREDALWLADKHGITARDLLEARLKRSREA